MSKEDRYQYDAQFRTLVDTLYMQIVNLNYTPTELRDAVMMAALKYEYSHIRKTFIIENNYDIK